VIGVILVTRASGLLASLKDPMSLAIGIDTYGAQGNLADNPESVKNPWTMFLRSFSHTRLILLSPSF